jgi:iron complex outermembrane receptor protein
VNASYSHKIFDAGTLNFSMAGTYLRELSVDTGLRPGVTGQDGIYDCKGFYGNTCGTPSSKWRHTARLGFTLPNGLGISGRWRYFSAVDLDTLSTDLDLAPGGPSAAPANAKINAQSFFDLALSARITDKYNFRLGANNILDKQPPIVGSEVSNAPFGNGNTYPQVYDALGRYLFAGVTVDF